MHLSGRVPRILPSFWYLSFRFLFPYNWTVQLPTLFTRLLQFQSAH